MPRSTAAAEWYSSTRRSIKCHLLVAAIVRSRAGQQPGQIALSATVSTTRDAELSSGSASVGIDGEPGPHPFQRLWSDPLHAPQIVDRAERTVLLAVRDDPPGERVADPVELSPLDPSGGVDVDAVFDLSCWRRSISIGTVPQRVTRSQYAAQERKHYEQDDRQDDLVRMAEPKTRSGFVRGRLGGSVRSGTGLLQPRLASRRSSRR